jgi:hypothetical protein
MERLNVARWVKARIRRMGKQWASCGVPVSPPDELRGQASAKRLCPKLVPGQVIEVPDTHNLLNQACVEIVRGIEPDEFLRPWVFKSSEEALLANPSKSRLGADMIAAGLSLAEGAQVKGRKAAEERQARQLEEDRDDGSRTPRSRQARAERAAELEYDDGTGDEATRDDEDDDYQPTSQNRVTREDADELRGTDEDEPEDKPVRRGRQPRKR